MRLTVSLLTEADTSRRLSIIACVRMAVALRDGRAREDMTMRGADKAVCQAAAALLVLALAGSPARAQFGGFGGGAGGEDMMTQMAPMLEMMKAKMGKRRFAMMMQTMGPMMSRMMDNGGGFGGGFGGVGGGFGGGIPSGFGGVSGYTPDAPAVGGGYGGGDAMGMLGGGGGSELMAMIPQLVRLGSSGSSHRRHRRR